MLLLRKAASLGVVRAQLQLGDLYLAGRGGVAADRDEAFRWYAVAARGGDAEALYQLGKCHRRGLGAPPDAAAALLCWTRAAAAGHGRARKRAGKLAADQECAAAARRVAASIWHAVFPRKADDAAAPALYAPLADGSRSPLYDEEGFFGLAAADDDTDSDASAYVPPRPGLVGAADPPPAAVFRGNRRLTGPNPFVDGETL